MKITGRVNTNMINSSNSRAVSCNRIKIEKKTDSYQSTHNIVAININLKSEYKEIWKKGITVNNTKWKSPILETGRRD